MWSQLQSSKPRAMKQDQDLVPGWGQARMMAPTLGLQGRGICSPSLLETQGRGGSTSFLLLASSRTFI